MEAGKFQLKAEGFEHGFESRETCCFAGRTDELVVSASRTNSLFIWSSVMDIEQHLLISQESGQEGIKCIRYNPVIDSLASCDAGDVVKVWPDIGSSCSNLTSIIIS